MESSDGDQLLPSGFEALPENCIANLLSLTTPRDACSSSLVSKTFRSAADADGVWQRFIPPDYDDIVARALNYQPLSKFSSMKENFLHSCDHSFLLDEGTTSFSIDKRSGKKCYMFCARSLSIVWGDTPNYWQWISLPDSRFTEVAKLVGVWWLEIRCKMNISMLSPDTAYVAFLVFNLTPTAYGFDYPPQEASIRIAEEESKTQFVCLDSTRRRRHRMQMAADIKYPKERSDGWLEVELGDFVTSKKEQYDHRELETSLMAVKDALHKTGLIVEGIQIRPKT